MSTFTPLAEGRLPRHYNAGQVIYLQGTSANEFYYLIKGTVRSYISSPSGGERILTIHQTGDLMGEASFFDECPRVSSAIAVTECDVVSIIVGYVVVGYCHFWELFPTSTKVVMMLFKIFA